MPRKLNKDGFGVLGIVAVTVILAAIAFAGWSVWHHDHKAKPTASNASTSNQKTPNPYANWKTYCDNVYGYCFKYPSGWSSLGDSTEPQKVGSPGGISLISPKHSVQITYSNAYTVDSFLASFVPTKIEKLSHANQNLTLLGGYSPSSGNNGVAGNNSPYYRIIDSSLLNKYPLQLGHTSQFPSAPRFTDKNSGFYGVLVADPATTIETVNQSKAWLKSEDALTSVKILESIYYHHS